MHFNGRGFYNTLLFSSTEAKKTWQTEDYSRFSTQQLFELLKPLKISLSESVFLDYSKNAESPEDLTDILCPDDEGTPSYEKSYLILFELWKRFNPNKESLSVFCDKLDHLIHNYDEGKPVADDLVKALWDLSRIFEGSSAQGLSQKKPMSNSQVIWLKI